MSADWVPGAVVATIMSAAGSLLSWRVASAKREGMADAELSRLNEKDSGLREDIQGLRVDLRDSTQTIQKTSDLLIALQARQDVVNAMSAKALESFSARQDELSRQVGDHGRTLAILNELLKRKGILE